MSRPEWESRAHPLLVALMELEDKAQDNGLTPDERIAHGVIEREYSRLVALLVEVGK